MATHSNILARKIPWTEEPGGLQSTGCKDSDPIVWLSTYSFNTLADIVGQALMQAQMVDPCTSVCLEGSCWWCWLVGGLKKTLLPDSSREAERGVSGMTAWRPPRGPSGGGLRVVRPLTWYMASWRPRGPYDLALEVTRCLFWLTLLMFK